MITEIDVRSIFAPFADQGTDLEISETTSHTNVDMFYFGERRKYQYNKGNGEIRDQNSKQPYPSINVLLASDQFSNLVKMTAAQKRIWDKKHPSTGNRPAAPLPTKVTIVYGDGRTKENSLGEDFSLFVQELLKPFNHSKKIKIILLDGAAGIGKTYFIERLAFEHAEHYLNREAFSPVLHATSRGRRLSVLEDAVAATIQDFRAEGCFSYEQVPTLVKRGLMHLAIDGFDELVDADGYAHAWKGLSNYLENIGENGVCILAGRDTFFDQKEFVNRLSSISHQLEVIQIHLSNVDKNEATKWLHGHGWDDSELKLLLEDAESYLLRPYFLTEIASVENKTFDFITKESASLKEFLITRFIVREAKIIKSTLPKGVVSTTDGDDDAIKLEKLCKAVSDFMCEVASEMSERESDFVDLDFLSFLCEYMFDSVLDNGGIQILKQKIRTMGLLEKCSLDNYRKFPHSEVQQFFTSIFLVQRILDKEIPSFLRRGIVGTDFLENFSDVFASERFNDSEAAQFIEFLKSKIETETSGDRFSQNASSILLACMFRTTPNQQNSDFYFENIYPNEVYLAGLSSWEQRRVVLRNMTIIRLDAQGADLSDFEFSETCSVATLLGNDTTKFGKSLPRVSMIYVNSGGNFRTLTTPEEITQWLSEHSTLNQLGSNPSLDYQNAPIYRLYERICRHSVKMTFIWPRTNKASVCFYKDTNWRV